MVFMGASTFEGNVPLGPAADADIAEMVAIGSKDGWLNIFVERHDDRSVQRHHIGGPQGSSFIRPVSQTRTLDGQDLRRFVQDALRVGEHRPQDHAMLVLWGHAFDFAFGRRRERDGTVDALDFAELKDRLGEIQEDMFESFEGRKPESGSELPTLDIIGFDSCELSTVEMAYQLYPYAQYLLGSEIGIPIPGWPYDRILDRLREPKGRMMGPVEFGSYIVRRYCESYEADEDAVSLTLLDLAHSAELADLAGWLARTLAIAIGNRDNLNRIADVFVRSQTDEGRPYVDVADLCLNLMRESSDAAIVDAAMALGNFLISPGYRLAGRSEEGEGRPLVAEHGRNAGRLARLNGISLYAPHVVPGRNVDAAERLYDNFTFAHENDWGALVHLLARS